MISGPLLFRADASVAMGTGHTMRCLALAQAWQDTGGRAVFAVAAATSAIRERLQSESCQVLSIPAPAGTQADAEQTIAHAREKVADWVVVDGYQFGADYQQALKAAGLRILFLDDYAHAGRYSADVVLNQNVSAGQGQYDHREPYTRLLLGPRYCILRREFGAWRNWRREIPAAGRRVLVTMGGSDPENLTGRIIESLSLVKLENIETTVVIGGSNPHFDSLQRSVAKCGKKITLRKDASDMAALMARADVAISAAGSTCWELCRLGLPALLIDTAENQQQSARELDRRECAIHVGNMQEVSASKVADQLDRLLRSQDLRQSISQHARELVDGKGAQRVVSVLRGGGFRLRRAREDDSRLLWEWANDPEVRSASFLSDPIPWETHVAWFGEKLRQSQCFIFIAQDDEGTPLGQIRFDAREDGSFEVGISVAKARRGQGVAAALLQLGVRAMVKEVRHTRIHAFVKPANQASIKIFEGANFKRIGDEQVAAKAAVHLIYDGQ